MAASPSRHCGSCGERSETKRARCRATKHAATYPQPTRNLPATYPQPTSQASGSSGRGLLRKLSFAKDRRGISSKMDNKAEVPELSRAPISTSLDDGEMDDAARRSTRPSPVCPTLPPSPSPAVPLCRPAAPRPHHPLTYGSGPSWRPCPHILVPDTLTGAGCILAELGTIRIPKLTTAMWIPRFRDPSMLHDPFKEIDSRLGG